MKKKKKKKEEEEEEKEENNDSYSLRLPTLRRSRLRPWPGFFRSNRYLLIKNT